MEIICGINAVFEVLRAGNRKVKRVIVAEGKKDGTVAEILNAASASGVRVDLVPKHKVNDLSKVETNQGVAAEVEDFRYSSVEEIIESAKNLKQYPFIIILDQINDPHNLGAIIRTAHQLGCHGVVIPKDNAAQIGPAATKAASGAVEYLPIAKVVNINTAIKLLKDNNIWVVGAEGESKQTIYQYDFTDGVAIILGGEGKGLRRLVKENCDVLLKIPTTGQIDSLNVSVAGAIFMAEVVRQRLSKNRAANP